MSKKRMTQQDLEAMGLVEQPDGTFAPKRKSDHPITKMQNNKRVEINVDALDHINRTPKQLAKLWHEAYPLLIESPEQEISFIHPKPFNIAAIRLLGSGTKSRNESMTHLHQFSEQLVKWAKNNPNVIYLPLNVASSKNSKEIGFYYKGKGKDRVKINTLVDSKAVKAYRKAMEAVFKAHEPIFRRMRGDKEYPLSVKYTFIRETIGRFDHQNAIQILADMGKDAGWFPDDDSEHFCPVFNPTVYYSKTLCGVVIEVI